MQVSLRKQLAQAGTRTSDCGAVKKRAKPLENVDLSNNNGDVMGLITDLG